MAALSIRNLDDSVRERLRQRAAAHGRSMEAEARAILTEAVAEDDARDFLGTIYATFQAIGGVELDIPPRTETMRFIDFSDFE